MNDRGAKITLGYPIPEEEDAAQMAMNGQKWAMVVFDMDNFLRGGLKYDDLPEPVYDALEKVRERLCELMEDHGVSLGDIP